MCSLRCTNEGGRKGKGGIVRAGEELKGTKRAVDDRKYRTGQDSERRREGK